MPSASRTRTALNRERVLRAGIDLADRNGVESLTMRKLGEALGVEAMSLYHHVASKDELLDGMVDLIFNEIDSPHGEDGEWKTAMRRRAASAREVLARHHWAIGLLDSRNSPGRSTMAHFESALRCLRTAGFSVDMTVEAYGVIYGYVYGFVLAFNRETGTQARRIIEHAPADEFPFATEATEYMLQRERGYMRQFETGLDLILDGLERALKAAPTPRRRGQ